VSGLPLDGVRVVELSHAVLGPTAGVILADLGADVIKVEPPGGDPTRELAGFGMGYFPTFNRNKQSLTLDLKRAEGSAVLHRLLADADVLLENYGPGTVDRLGFGYAELAPRYPRLIFCSLKGFLPGPYRDRVALDEVVQMMSGLAYMTGPPGRPLRAGASVIDMTTGMMGAMGVLLALRDRDTSGRGQVVEGALFETAAFLMGHHMAYHLASGEPVPPMTDRASAWAIYHPFATADGETLFVGVTSDKQWPRFCRAFGRDDLLADPTLATNNLRVAAQPRLLPDLRTMFADMPLAEALRRCQEADLPFSPIARPEDLFEDPQLVGGESLFETTFPDGTRGRLPKLPLRLGGRHPTLRSDPPQVGADGGTILRGLGYTEADIAQMVAAGVVTLPAPVEGD
jgi:crotonobetainyl-CoA:carnitine CoA-transferase CaiB-like acyl-CoA transferase